MAPPGFRKAVATAPKTQVDAGGAKFDPRIHAQYDDGSAKKDSVGNFIERALDYVRPVHAHYGDTFRHGPAETTDSEK